LPGAPGEDPPMIAAGPAFFAFLCGNSSPSVEQQTTPKKA
jgi:hypothetical protein